jgi:hypothetical protein
LEDTAKNWPGLVFRRYNSSNELEVTQTISKVKASYNFLPASYPINIKIVRIDKIIYYSVND